MPRISWSGLDLYALVDSDSEEAKQFQTYSFYWQQLARHVVGTYGADSADGLTAELQGRKPYRALSASQFKGDTATLKQILSNAWSNELMLYSVDVDDPRLLTAVQWFNVYTYYATGMAALAWLHVRNGQAPTAHRRLLDALAEHATGTRLLPSPWCCHLTTHAPLGWGGFSARPAECSNLQSVDSVPPLDAVGKLLKTTRGKRLDERAAEARRVNGGRLPRGERGRIDTSMTATTIFDFTWRSRTRANYGSPAMFFKGALGNLDSCEKYVNALRTYTDATMLLFEAFISQRARRPLAEAATEFISRDRTKCSDALVGRRLKVLGALR